MNVYKITYLDYVEAENEEQAKDILLEQLSMDVRRDDASAFNIELSEDKIKDDGQPSWEQEWEDFGEVYDDEPTYI